MPKDKFWFTHDLNARNDRKIAPLVKDYKSSGYGIFWGAVEMMHEEGGKLEFDDITFAAIAKDLNESTELVAEVIKKCISVYKLFKLTDNLLISNRVDKNLNDREESRNKKSKAGKASAEKRKHSTSVEQVLNNDEQASTGVEQNPTQTEQTVHIENVFIEEKKDSSIGNLTNSKESFNTSTEDFQKKSKSEPQDLTKQMLAIYKKTHPKYRGNLAFDEMMCGEISFIIAEINGWAKESVTNGKAPDVLTEWSEAMEYTKSDKYWFGKTLRQLSDPSTWNNFHNILNFNSNGSENRKNGAYQQTAFKAGRDNPIDKP